MRKILIILKNIVLIIGCVSFLFSWVEILHSKLVKKNVYEGLPEKIYKRELPFVGELTDFAVVGNTLYVLFDGSQELRCYNENGDYLCSYLYAACQKGRAELHCNMGFLYLEDREHNFYVFENGEFIEYLDATTDMHSINDAKTEFDTPREQRSTESGAYFYVKRGSLWKQYNSSAEEVLHRPLWALLFNRTAHLVITLASACLVLMLKWFIAHVA